MSKRESEGNEDDDSEKVDTQIPPPEYVAVVIEQNASTNGRMHDRTAMLTCPVELPNAHLPDRTALYRAYTQSGRIRNIVHCASYFTDAISIDMSLNHAPNSYTPHILVKWDMVASPYCRRHKHALMQPPIIAMQRKLYVVQRDSRYRNQQGVRSLCKARWSPIRQNPT